MKAAGDLNNLLKKSAITEFTNKQKPISFFYYIKSDVEHVLPSGCHPFFADDCKTWFVKKLQELESKCTFFKRNQHRTECR